MQGKLQERYVFYIKATGDIEAALQSLALIPKTDDNYIKAALIRDAIVSYCRPFTRNDTVFPHSRTVIKKGQKKKKVSKQLWLPHSFVPPRKRVLQRKVMWARNKLIAHSPLKEREPRLALLGGQFFVTMKGFYYKELISLEAPLKGLCQTMLNKLTRSLQRRGCTIKKLVK